MYILKPLFVITVRSKNLKIVILSFSKLFTCQLGLTLGSKLIDNCLCIIVIACLYINSISQPAFNCSKLTIETLEQGVKYVQS